MAVLYVICDQSDIDLLRERVLGGLAIYGYDRWLNRSLLATSSAQAIRECPATLVVATQALLSSTAALDEIELALDEAATLIFIRLGQLDESLIPTRLRARPQVDFTAEGAAEAQRELGALLPPVHGLALPPEERGASVRRLTHTEGPSQRIAWNEASFTAALKRATARHDYARARALIESFAVHAYQHLEPYPAKQASADLQLLRQDRAFELMIPLARAVMQTGTRQDRVLRLYAQALIETRAYDEALEVLNSIVAAPVSSRAERFEARGLIGRVYKQLYVESRPSEEALSALRHAIHAYREAYSEDNRNLWHGVNAATCLLRLSRDTHNRALQADAQAIANSIVEQLSAHPTDMQLDVWDCATKVEALLVLEKYEQAAQALERYIHHPAMEAFEASSTLRQFEQLLDLQETPMGWQLHARMRETVERYRAGGSVGRLGQDERDAHAQRPLVIRMRDPHAQLEDIVGLTQQQRIGPIITAYGNDASVRALLRHPAVISIEQSRPAGRPECVRSLPFIRVAAEYPSPTGPFKETGDAALIAIIDDGIDVLHAAFRDANGASRIVGIWDQNAMDGTPPLGFSYGHFHDAASIAAAVQADQYPPGLPRNDDGHGTHVASIAAGRAAGEFAGGVAPDARLLVVISANIEPIGYSKTHLEALTFIDQFATKCGLPVVVNLSQGMNAGAHDGTSSLEVGFNYFTKSGTAPGRVIVKSAGNERDKGGHAKITLAPNSLEELRWQRKPGADACERLELWWSSDDEIEFRLRAPDSDWSDWVGSSAPERTGHSRAGSPYKLTFTGRHIDNGDNLLLIELGSPAKSAALGEWRLELQSGSHISGGEVHAWIERTQGVPSTFLDHANEEMTLSIPSTALNVISVGAVDARTPIKVGSFSSYGPTRAGDQKPTVGAPGVEVRAARGGTIDQVDSRSGTSMAAPHVAGAIALLLSRRAKANKQLGSNQIAKALCQKTRNSNGKWDRGQGWGVVDVAALLAAFSAGI